MQVISELGLTDARETVVGSDREGERGLSGGEKKRLNIGLDLLHNPPLIFLDEPTSGLDSFQAQQVMTTLRELTLLGHTVVCSIHQVLIPMFHRKASSKCCIECSIECPVECPPRRRHRTSRQLLDRMFD